MSTYKYTDASNQVAHVIDDDGISRSSCLASTLPEGSVIEPYTPTPAELNAPILSALTALDAKSVRALREDDTVRLTAIENEAIALRAQLV